MSTRGRRTQPSSTAGGTTPEYGTAPVEVQKVSVIKEQPACFDDRKEYGDEGQSVLEREAGDLTTDAVIGGRAVDQERVNALPDESRQGSWSLIRRVQHLWDQGEAERLRRFEQRGMILGRLSRY